MKKRSGYLLRNIGILTIGNFASKILVFFLVPLYTSVLSTEEYGTYDLIVSTISLAYPILTVNIVDALLRFCMDSSCSKEDVITIGAKYILRSILAAGIIAILVRCFKILFPIKNLELYVFIYYVAYVLNQFCIQLAKGLERVREMAVSGVVGTVVALTGNVLFLTVFRWGLVGFFAANILAQAIQSLFLATRLKAWSYVKPKHIDKRIQKEMLAYCAPLIFTVLGWWVNSAADRYVVTFMCGLAANGILSVAYKIPSILNIFQNIFTQAWQISAIKEYGEKDSAGFYGDTFKVINTLICAACAWLIILSKPLAHILYANDFYQAWQYVPFLLISGVFNCASGFLGPILSAKKDSRTMAMSAIYGAVVNIVMNILLVYLMGVQGAVVATAISSYVIYIVRMRAGQSDILIERYEEILITWGLLCVQAIVEIYTPFWYLEFLLMAIMLVVNRTSVKNIFSMILKLVKH